VLAAANIRAHHGEPSWLEARFPDSELLLTFDRRLLLRAAARDVSGVTLASLGFPDPVPFPIEDAPDLARFTVPWWGWIAGGVAAVGAASVAVFLLTKREPSHGIGSVTADF
jgi:hypothetical protein